MLLTMNSPSFLINTHKKTASYFHVCYIFPYHSINNGKEEKRSKNWWYDMKYKFRNTNSEKLSIKQKENPANVSFVKLCSFSE